jgi:hypothetical protein
MLVVILQTLADHTQPAELLNVAKDLRPPIQPVDIICGALEAKMPHSGVGLIYN